MAIRRSALGAEHVDVLAKRVAYLIEARIRDRKKMLAASEAIDRLRRKVRGFDSVQEIRRWRNRA